jgi:flavin reductase (DIM6/NTAB) family NADH-FMN oxidoreductase RutF
MAFEISTNSAGLNQACFKITHGLYILTAKNEKLNGQCIDAVMQVTNMPPRVAIGVGKRSLTSEMIAESGEFVINVIDRDDSAKMDVVKHFGFQSGRKVDKFADYPHELGELGLPILPDAKAFFECRVIKEMSADLETHMLYTASIVRAGVSEEGTPFTYTEYRDIKSKGG